MTLSRALLAAVALAAVTSISTGAGAANLLVNGSFEDATNFVANGGVDEMELFPGSTAMTGWTVVGSHDLAWIGPANTDHIVASDGSYSLDLAGFENLAPYAGVSQTIATHAGGHYLLSFDLGSAAAYGLPDGLVASAGSTSAVFTSTATGPMNWEHETLAFTAAGSTTNISLVGNLASPFYIGLDNVSVTAVPEPTTWALMLVGFGGLGAAMRSRRKQGAAVATA